MMNVLFPIVKIAIYKAETSDIVFIFTGVRTPAGDYIQMQITCPVGEGEKWVFQTFKTVNYEIVLEGFEVAAPV